MSVPSTTGGFGSSVDACEITEVVDLLDLTDLMLGNLVSHAEIEQITPFVVTSAFHQLILCTKSLTASSITIPLTTLRATCRDAVGLPPLAAVWCRMQADSRQGGGRLDCSNTEPLPQCERVQCWKTSGSPL